MYKALSFVFTPAIPPQIPAYPLLECLKHLSQKSKLDFIRVTVQQPTTITIKSEAKAKQKRSKGRNCTSKRPERLVSTCNGAKVERW